MPEEVEIHEDEGLLLKTPASIETLSGEIEVWGAQIDRLSLDAEGIELLITSSRTSKVLVEGNYVKFKDPIPSWWRELPDILIDKRTLLIGRTDSGKSSTVLFLSNKLTAEGERVSIIDSDLGQSDLGPPGVISEKDLTHPVAHTKLLEPDFMYFVGDKTPSGHLLPMIKGVLCGLKAAGSNTVIINTTGFVDGVAARILKRFKVEFAEPDLIIAIEKEEGDLKHIVRTLPKGPRVLRFISPAKKVKSRNHRIAARKALLGRYLAGSTTRRLKLEELHLLNTFLLTGNRKDEYIPFLEQILNVGVHWLEESPDMLIVLTDSYVNKREIVTLSSMMNKEIRVGTLTSYSGLYVGLMSDGVCRGVGLLKSLNLREGWMEVITVYKGPIDGVAMGYIRFNAEGEEIGFRGTDVP